MASLTVARNILLRLKDKPIHKIFARSLMSKQLVYNEFGDPLRVVKLRECEVQPLKGQEVLVKMLAAPVNPADINTIQGRSYHLPSLPCVPGDEGVGEIVEVGNKVCTLEIGERVVFTSRNLGTWRYYGIYNQRNVHVISPNIPLPEASMITSAPCMAYRMLKDYRRLNPGETVMLNAANSPCGQCVIQLCKAWDIKTLNIVANTLDYTCVRNHLLDLGGTAVYTLEEAEELHSFNTSLSRPVLGLNCLGGRYEDVMLRILQKNGTIVYYGCSFDLPMVKHYFRNDLQFCRFNLNDWNIHAGVIERDVMMNDIIQLIAIGKFIAPLNQSVYLRDYIGAFRNTLHCEAFTIINYVFDFSVD